MAVELEAIKQLRDKSGAGFMDCKAALVEAKGDLAKAEEVLRKRGITLAKKKSGRVAKEGCIYAYIHAGDKIGVLLEVNCESDFVARTPEFRELVKNLALQVAAASPLYVSKEQVPEDKLQKEREILKDQVKDKPANVVEKIVTGRLGKYYQEVCLLEQPFIRDQNVKVGDLITQFIGKTGENVVVRRFTRYELGEETGC